MAPVKPPLFSTTPVVSAKVFKTYTIPAAASQNTTIIIVAPYNDVVAAAFHQLGALSATVLPTGLLDSGVAPYANWLTLDPLVTDLLAPDSTSGSVNAVPYRVVDLCVEISTTQAISTVSGSLKFGRWTQGAVPALSTGLATEFYDTASTILSLNPVVLSCADLLETHCLACSARNRGALEFRQGTGQAPWISAYGDTSTLGNNSSWDPIFVLFQGTNRPELTLSFRGRIETQPPPNTFPWRMASFPAPVQNGQEERWWQAQRLMSMSSFPLRMAGPTNRSYTGLTGRPPAQNGSTTRAPKQLRSSTTAAPKKGTRAAKMMQAPGPARGKQIKDAVLDTLLQLVTGRGPLPEMVRLTQGRAGPRLPAAIRNGELRRRRR